MHRPAATMVAMFGLAIATVAAQRVELIGGPPAAAQARVLEPGTGVILGRAVDAGITTTGVSGAIATLTGSALGSPAAMFMSGVPGGSRRVEADGQGRFVFRELPVGTYSLTVTAAGYADGRYGDNRLIQIRRTLDLNRTIEITPGERLVNADVRLWRNGGVGGVVVDERGDPMVGVPVNVFARVKDWGGVIMQSTMAVTTDDRGRYHADVTAGDYLVAVLAATSTFPSSAVEGFRQAMDQGGAAQQAYMQQMVASGGVLPRGVGTRIGDLFVSQFGTRNTAVVPPFPFVNGRQLFYPTTFHPSATSALSAAVVTIASGEEKDGIDVQVRALPVLRVSGQVTGPGGPLGGQALRLLPSDPAAMRTTPATIIGESTAVADGTGRFTFAGVAPGEYTLSAMRTPSGATDPLLWAVTPIVVGDGDVKDVAVLLREGVRITGRIVVDAAGPAPSLAAVRALAIAARPLPGTAGSLVTSSYIERPDESQRFTTRPLIPGNYMMTISGLPTGWVLKSVSLSGRDAVDTAFELPSTGAEGMVVTITDRVSTLSGFVRDDAGRPATAATIGVFPADKALWRLAGMASRRVQTAAPGRDGRYSFRGLPAGEYIVAAVGATPVDFSDPADLTKLMTSAPRVTLTDGASASQDLKVTVVR